ncbi:hypothetical protein [Priestia megaterium]|uniref:hypothetical protein n=1 Tax=Priestia megaterium TaxID=1404 RepID=UPI002E1C3383|nr:hypothetical protein [Priestia megaterium]
MSQHYYISDKDNEYFQVLSIISHLLEKAKNEGNYAVWGESLEKLKTQLEDNKGQNITPWQYNMIINVLLDFVPEDIKKI